MLHADRESMEGYGAHCEVASQGFDLMLTPIVSYSISCNRAFPQPSQQGKRAPTQPGSEVFASGAEGHRLLCSPEILGMFDVEVRNISECTWEYSLQHRSHFRAPE